MTIKNLAYLALLAGWLSFCYWLYAEGISPRLHHLGNNTPNVLTDSIPYPLAFRWASDSLLTGVGFEKFKAGLDAVEVADEIIVIRGYFFRDEASDPVQLNTLASRRIDNTVRFLALNKRQIVTEVSPQEITADVRSNPFEAVRFERIPMKEMIKMSRDTFEICFPLKDSLVIPLVCMDSLVSWISHPGVDKSKQVHITGTADGSGIAEPMDLAMERALWIKNAVLAAGWKEEQILLSTGQRNHPLTLRNRCVVLYFE